MTSAQVARSQDMGYQWSSAISFSISSPCLYVSLLSEVDGGFAVGHVELTIFGPYGRTVVFLLVDHSKSNEYMRLIRDQCLLKTSMIWTIINGVPSVVQYQDWEESEMTCI